MEEGHIPQKRNAKFAEGFLHLERRRRERRDGVVERVPGLGEIIEVVAVGFTTIFATNREADRTTGQFEQLAQVARD